MPTASQNTSFMIRVIVVWGLLGSMLGACSQQPATCGPNEPGSPVVATAETPPAPNPQVTIPAPTPAASTPGSVSSPDASADIRPGAMPPGTTWSGVYYGPVHGFLHLVQNGKAVEGKWIRPRKDRFGELRGQIQGNLLSFEWTEHIIGLVGPNATQAGKGYFLYTRPEQDDADDVIRGEVVQGQDEAGSPWQAIKQRNLEPDLGSLGVDSDTSGGDWDSP